jgi:hypothetical protein
LETHELRPCPYDKTLFRLDDDLLFVTTQVDNFIFTGTDVAMKKFTDYMASRFRLSELEFDNFSVYGTLFSRDGAGFHINEKEKIDELVEYPLMRDRRRMHEEPVTRAERLFYMSTVGSMLFVGRVTSPVVARVAGVLARSLPSLAVKDIKADDECGDTKDKVKTAFNRETAFFGLTKSRREWRFFSTCVYRCQLP